jgi:hypothetical protein
LFDLAANHDEMADLAPLDVDRRAAMVNRLAASLIDHADDSRGTPVTV